MISREKLNKLSKLDNEELVQILDECIELLGTVDVPEAMKILCISRPRIYQKMNNKNSVKIGNHKFPCINLIIK